jgi:hypothetical protein
MRTPAAQAAYLKRMKEEYAAARAAKGRTVRPHLDLAEMTPAQKKARRAEQMKQARIIRQERAALEPYEPHESCSEHTADEIMKLLDGAKPSHRDAERLRG